MCSGSRSTALPSDAIRLADAWRVLSGLTGTEGWRSTYLATIGISRVLAARRMPDDMEAVLLGFPGIRLPDRANLPSGRGFLVEAIKTFPLPGLAFVALSRQPGARLDLFETMAQDVVSALREEEATDNARVVLARMLERVRAWQEFMARERGGVLDEEGEIGLHGELHVLLELVDRFPDAVTAVNAWQGPVRGLHDFALPIGSLEVKSTTAPVGFRATIAALDQLDPAVRSPLHVAAVRLAEHAAGLTLAERVAQMRERLTAASQAALQTFSLRVLQAGFIEAMAPSYTRRFQVSDVRLLPVAGSFPMLTARTVPRGVVSARYVIDLDAADLLVVSFAEVLHDGARHDP